MGFRAGRDAFAALEKLDRGRGLRIVRGRDIGAAAEGLIERPELLRVKLLAFLAQQLSLFIIKSNLQITGK